MHSNYKPDEQVNTNSDPARVIKPPKMLKSKLSGLHVTTQGKAKASTQKQSEKKAGEMYMYMCTFKSVMSVAWHNMHIIATSDSLVHDRHTVTDDHREGWYN